MARSARDERRALRFAGRRRIRGGDGRAPIPVQRLARQMSDTATVAREAGVRAAGGTRLYLIGVAAVIVLGFSILSGPIDQFFAGRDRVDLLERQLAALDTENERLQERAEDLRDPAQVELHAREQQGWHEPGEVPFVIVPPDSNEPLVDEAIPPLDERNRPWYRDLWEWFSGLFG